ncbi:putative protein STRUBBELIG-RECEPTOR FAMILY 8 [Cocos nucifera]|uniref:Uncharacterized protein n=1 Tax=Cocos nucifera TaxID=13894 RepID=A0A8K0IPX8_COCNU|nr:putative protein STRUBBELIG-RECEPTOR FAMILY 8 [Cocos nucifera]
MDFTFPPSPPSTGVKYILHKRRHKQRKSPRHSQNTPTYGSQSRFIVLLSIPSLYLLIPFITCLTPGRKGKALPILGFRDGAQWYSGLPPFRSLVFENIVRKPIHIPFTDIDLGVSCDCEFIFFFFFFSILDGRDISNNNLHEGIPYQLPPNLTYLNLAKNNLSGSLPFSISTIISLNYFNLSHNSLSQQIGDIFANLQDLSELDLSFNNLTGDLPNSLSSLSNLSSLYLQDNQLTGPVNLLASLDLTTLNIANNNFSGWIPQKFSSIPNLM